MDPLDDTTRRTTLTPSFDVNEDDVNEDDVDEDALFEAPPEPDDTTEFHDAHPIASFPGVGSLRDWPKQCRRP